MGFSEKDLIRRIEADIKLQCNTKDELIPGNLGNSWEPIFLKETGNLINRDLSINPDMLKNFRKSFVLLVDFPIGRQYLNIRNLLDGQRRGQQKVLQRHWQILKERGYDYLLKRYPCSLVGNPFIYRYQGCSFTWRWIKNVYYAGLFKKILAEKIRQDFILMDIGCGYGIFSYILKNEFQKSHHVLVDLPQQLVLAHYFLAKHFPDAKIATYKDIFEVKKIDRNFLNKYDFILIPWHMYTKIEHGGIDILTNFVSFAEMGRKYFDYYLKQEPFLSVEYFFTVNRFVSAPTYDNGLTILDYQLASFRALHFAIFPLVMERYRRSRLFFYRYFPHESQLFEFIGERQKI